MIVAGALAVSTIGALCFEPLRGTCTPARVPWSTSCRKLRCERQYRAEKQPRESPTEKKFCERGERAMGLVVQTALHPEQDEHGMFYEWFVGIDWGSQQPQVWVLDRDRRRVGERSVDHDGASLARLADWLWTVAAGQRCAVCGARAAPRSGA